MDVDSILCWGRSHTSRSSYTHKQQLLSPCAETPEARVRKTHAPQQEEPLQWEAQAPQLRRSPCLLQQSNPQGSNEEPAQPEKKIKCNALESSPNHPPASVRGKLSSTKLVPDAKDVGDHCPLRFLLLCQENVLKGCLERFWSYVPECLAIVFKRNFSSNLPWLPLGVHYTSGISWPPRQRAQEASICIIFKCHVLICVP